MTLPDHIGADRPPFLSEDWEWSDETSGWERTIGSSVIVYVMGFFSVYDISNRYYAVEMYDFIMDQLNADRSSPQQVIEQFENYGQIEGGYDLNDDLAGLVDDLTEPWTCHCGFEDFYVMAQRDEFLGSYVRTYYCANPECDKEYQPGEIPEGIHVNILNISYVE